MSDGITAFRATKEEILQAKLEAKTELKYALRRYITAFGPVFSALEADTIAKFEEYIIGKEINDE